MNKFCVWVEHGNKHTCIFWDCDIFYGVVNTCTKEIKLPKVINSEQAPAMKNNSNYKKQLKNKLTFSCQASRILARAFQVDHQAISIYRVWNLLFLRLQFLILQILKHQSSLRLLLWQQLQHYTWLNASFWTGKTASTG